MIGQLMNGLKQMNLHRCVNVIVVGDHGTTAPPQSLSLTCSARRRCAPGGRAGYNAHVLSADAWAESVSEESHGQIMLAACVAGMEEAHCDWTEFLSNYPLNIEEITLIPGSLGRIRPRDPRSTTCKTRANNPTLYPV